MSKTPTRSVRSYVLRQGRMTDGQKRQYDALWPQYGLELPDKPLEFDALFKRLAPTVLEIGFGMGQSLQEMAHRRPELNFIGIEVHKPGVARLMMDLADKEITNVKLFHQDALPVIKGGVPNNSLHGVHLYFPDPWPKKKHHKRRIVQKPFVALLMQKLQTDGYLHFATDWEDYALHMKDILSSTKGLREAATTDTINLETIARPTTRFESRGIKLGHEIYEFLYIPTES